MSEEHKSTQLEIVKITSNILNILSSISCIGIIVMFLLVPKTRSFATSIVFQLCLWCLISHFIVLIIDPSHLFKNGKQTTICYIQGALLTTFNTALLLWSTLIFIVSLFNFRNPNFFIRNRISCGIVTSLICWLLPMGWGLL